MNKPQIKQMIASQVKVICKSDKDMAISRWKRAKAFYEIFSMIVWAKSPYKSFESFVKEEFIDINPGSARIWVIHYTQMSKWYTWPQIQTMTKSVAYTRATQAQQAWRAFPRVCINRL